MLEDLENGLGLDVVVWLQERGNGLFDALAQALNFAGLIWFFLLTLTLFYWAIDKSLGRRLLFALGIELLVIFALKAMFDRPRPFESPRVDLLFSEIPSGGGLPSGHAAIAVFFWGLVARWLRHRWAWVTLIVYALLSGWARIYGGAHFPQDVVVGWLLGGLLLLTYPSLAERFPRVWERLPLWVQFGAVTGIGVIVIVRAWNDEDALSVAAALLGAGLGLLIEIHYVRFRIMGKWWWRALVYVAGILLLALAFFGMRVAFTNLNPPEVFRVIRYGATALLAVVIYPWILVRMRGFASAP